MWAAHAAVFEGHDEGAREFETDRIRFLGRGRTLRHALAMQPGAALSNTSGCVLVPIFSLRQQVRILPGASVRVAFWTALADSRENALALVQSLRPSGACEQVLAGSRAHAIAAQVRLGIDAAQAERFGHLAGALLYADSTLRAPAAMLERGSGGAPTLWGCGISGDHPIVLARSAAESDLAHLDELLLAQRYWQSKRLGVDVVLLNTAARIVLDASNGWPDPASGNRDGDWAPSRATAGNALTPSQAVAESAASTPPITHPKREFDNGTGGFIDSGRTYAVTLDGNCCTPTPWISVIANPFFGFLVSSEGGGYAWSLNSQQNPLTPWPNDPVSVVFMLGDAALSAEAQALIGEYRMADFDAMLRDVRAQWDTPCCGRQRDNSPRAMCSMGGCRLRGKAYARESATIA